MKIYLILSNFAVSHCKERWRNLRACLSRYIKQQGGSEPQHKPYYLTEHMQYLLPFLKSNQHLLTPSTPENTPNPKANSSNNSDNDETRRNNFSELPSMCTTPLKIKLFERNGKRTGKRLAIGRKAGCFMKHSPGLDGNDHVLVNKPKLPSSITTAPVNCVPTPDVEILMTSDGNPGTSSSRPDGLDNGDGGTGDTDDTGDFSLPTIEKRRKLDQNSYTNNTSSSSLSDNHDIDFFRSILPDLDGMTLHQKRQFKIGVLSLIDDTLKKYPERATAGRVNAFHGFWNI